MQHGHASLFSRSSDWYEASLVNRSPNSTQKLLHADCNLILVWPQALERLMPIWITNPISRCIDLNFSCNFFHFSSCIFAVWHSVGCIHSSPIIGIATGHLSGIHSLYPSSLGQLRSCGSLKHVPRVLLPISTTMVLLLLQSLRLPNIT